MPSPVDCLLAPRFNSKSAGWNFGQSGSAHAISGAPQAHRGAPTTPRLGLTDYWSSCFPVNHRPVGKVRVQPGVWPGPNFRPLQTPWRRCFSILNTKE
jgi:hypothetical protein